MTARQVKLNEILTDQQLRDVESIIRQIMAGQTRLDSLRFYLVSQKDSLEAKEVDPNYLFYAVAYAYQLF